MTIYGTERDDLLVGIPGAHDIIFGRGGNDTFRGGESRGFPRINAPPPSRPAPA